MSKKSNQKDHEKEKDAPSEPIVEVESVEENGFYSQQELAFSDIARSIMDSLRNAYADGVSRKELRKKSGLKKKAFRAVEGVDMDARLGDVLKVLAAAGKTLAIVSLEDVQNGAAKAGEAYENAKPLVIPDDREP